MSTATAIEFSPDYFKVIFTDDPAEWMEFIQVNLRTFKEGLDRIQEAAAAQDIDTVSEVRHALGPSMKQWGTVTLERQMMALTGDNLTEQWPLIEPEFKALISALEQLK